VHVGRQPQRASDTLQGGAGDDSLSVNNGVSPDMVPELDQVYGDAGNDRISVYMNYGGASGNVVAEGGAGSDTFALNPSGTGYYT
jgi:hypothetical protein